MKKRFCWRSKHTSWCNNPCSERVLSKKWKARSLDRCHEMPPSQCCNKGKVKCICVITVFPPQLPLYAAHHLHWAMYTSTHHCVELLACDRKGIMGVKEAGKQHVGCIYLQVTRAGLPADHTIIVGIHCSESILHSSGYNRTVQQDHQIIRLFKDCPKSWFKLPILTEISYLKPQSVSPTDSPLFLPTPAVRGGHICWRFGSAESGGVVSKSGPELRWIHPSCRDWLQNFLPDWARIETHVHRVFAAGSPFLFTYLNQSNP